MTGKKTPMNNQMGFGSGPVRRMCKKKQTQPRSGKTKLCHDFFGQQPRLFYCFKLNIYWVLKGTCLVVGLQKERLHFSSKPMRTRRKSNL